MPSTMPIPANEQFSAKLLILPLARCSITLQIPLRPPLNIQPTVCYNRLLSSSGLAGSLVDAASVLAPVDLVEIDGTLKRYTIYGDK